ncbi:MAG: hypothetical protein L6R40_000222 [Gallowayella cf. fulva]|nr:MAG: hypothetical protein L6R40_000222 [Xanthomendoza cf. fulva]
MPPSPSKIKPQQSYLTLSLLRQFEIASEETDKKSVYAADDREAAREELENLKTAFEIAVQGENGEEVRRRVGNRIRELEQGVVAMEERAMED